MLLSRAGPVGDVRLVAGETDAELLPRTDLATWSCDRGSYRAFRGPCTEKDANEVIVGDSLLRLCGMGDVVVVVVVVVAGDADDGLCCCMAVVLVVVVVALKVCNAGEINGNRTL